MNFSRCLLSSTVLAGGVFAIATLPLAVMSSQLVTIQLEEEPLFTGQLKELAAPYLGMATAISLGTGIVSLAAAGWRRSSRKLALAENQLSTLKQQIEEKEMMLESLQFSTSKLAASGLDFFLQEEGTALPQPAETAHSPVQYTIVETVQPVYPAATAQPPAPQGAVASAPSMPAQAVVNQQTRVQAAASMSSAQAFMGFARPTFSDVAAGQSAAEMSQPVQAAQMHELLSHLKQVMTQIEGLQTVQPTPQGLNDSHAIWQQQQLAS